MRRLGIWDIGFGVVALGLGMFIVGQFIHPSAQTRSRLGKVKLPPIPKEPVDYSGVPAQQVRGVAAITPPSSQVTAPSSDDVRRFLTSAKGPLSIKGLPNVSIGTVDCSSTAAKVKDVLGGRDLGLPADMPVCYAVLHGSFTFHSPPMPGSPRGTEIKFHNAFRVFDAKTGNIMATGFFDQPVGR